MKAQYVEQLLKLIKKQLKNADDDVLNCLADGLIETIKNVGENAEYFWRSEWKQNNPDDYELFEHIETLFKKESE